MHLDGRRLADGTELVTGTCVVGAGPAGLAVADCLARAGRDVILLESGTRRERPAHDALNAGRVEGGAYAGLQATRARAVGGTSHRWNTTEGGRSVLARYLPLTVLDLAGWPLDGQDLASWYPEAYRMAGITPDAARHDASKPEPGLARRLAAAGLEAATYRFGSQRHWISHVPREIRASRHVRLVEQATAVWIRYADGARAVAGLEASTLAGTRLMIRAQEFVLAAGAIENARLLLASVQRSAGAPGNAGGWLGAGFMEHPRDFHLRLAPDGLLSRAAMHWCDTHAGPDGWIGAGHLVPSPAALVRAALPGFGVSLFPLRVPGPVARALGLVRQPGYGWSRRRLHLPWEGYRLVLNLEQRAQRANAVVLDETVDRFGVPRPVLRWRWTAEEQEELDRARAWLAGALAEAGVGRLVWERGRAPDPNAHHHAGTTRMAASAADGVVDVDCRVHGVGNLYVLGASVFPTAGYANPMLTILALAARLAGRLGEG